MSSERNGELVSQNWCFILNYVCNVHEGHWCEHEDHEKIVFGLRKVLLARYRLKRHTFQQVLNTTGFYE